MCPSGWAQDCSSHTIRPLPTSPSPLPLPFSSHLSSNPPQAVPIRSLSTPTRHSLLDGPSALHHHHIRFIVVSQRAVHFLSGCQHHAAILAKATTRQTSNEVSKKKQRIFGDTLILLSLFPNRHYTSSSSKASGTNAPAQYIFGEAVLESRRQQNRERERESKCIGVLNTSAPRSTLQDLPAASWTINTYTSTLYRHLTEYRPRLTPHNVPYCKGILGISILQVCI